MDDFPSGSKEVALAVLDMARKSLISEKPFMKILPDESLPRKLRYNFGEDHEVLTIRDKGWPGRKNGELLKLMTEDRFEWFTAVAEIFHTNKI